MTGGFPPRRFSDRIAELLELDFDELMAKAGRFGEDADRYMRKHPTVGVLFRQLSESSMRMTTWRSC